MSGASDLMSGISEFLEEEDKDRHVELELSQIEPDPDQDRYSWDKQETIDHVNNLAASARQSGIRRPIEVYEREPNVFRIIAGEARYRAAQLADLVAIPAIVRVNSDARQRSIDMFTENFHRLSLNPMELARGLRRRVEEGFTPEELWTAAGKDKTWFSRVVGLLELPDDVQTLAESGAVRDPARLHALARIDDEARVTALDDIQSGEATVGDVLAAQKPARRKKKPARKKVSPKKADELSVSFDDARLLVQHFFPNAETASDADLLAGLARVFDSLQPTVVVDEIESEDAGERTEKAE